MTGSWLTSFLFVVAINLLQCSTQDNLDHEIAIKVSTTFEVKQQHVLLPHKANASSTVPVNFTFTFPEVQHGQKHSPRPLVLLLNGASVEKFWYSRIISDLASKGFVIAASDYYRPLNIKSPVLPRPHCRRDAIINVSARLINTVYDFTRSGALLDPLGSDLAFLQLANLDKLLLLSHSLGGYVAFKVLTGACDEAAEDDGTCEGYQPVHSSEGDDVVIGTAAFEGYIPDEEMSLREGTFALFLSGQYNKDTKAAYDGAREKGACASYFSFHNMSHFGINDYVSTPHSHQVTPCAVPNPHDDPTFTTDAATQQAGNDLLADIIDTAVTVHERGDDRDKAALRALSKRDQVLTAHVHAHCLSKNAASIMLDA